MQSEYAFTLPARARRRDGHGAPRGHDAPGDGARRDRAAAGRSRCARTRRTSSVLLLARTVTRIGEFTEITPELVEGLYAADFDHLQRLYERINTDGEAVGVVACPACAHEFEVDLTEIEDGRLGE